MWDIQLFPLNLFFDLTFIFFDIIFYIINLINPYVNNGLMIFNWKIFFQFPQNLTFIFALKFICSIAFLVLIRGGTPRYRYDYLTKLGWLKFLGLIILVFFFSLLIFFIF